MEKTDQELTEAVKNLSIKAEEEKNKGFKNLQEGKKKRKKSKSSFHFQQK
jgi:hypothetical protein